MTDRAHEGEHPVYRVVPFGWLGWITVSLAVLVMGWAVYRQFLS